MRILHGEHIIKSRDKLTAILQAAQAKKQDVVRLLAKEVTPALLEETFASTSLFGTEKLIVIEELHSLPKSAKKDALIEQISQSDPTLNLVLWEKRQLTATMLKKFKGAVAEEFPSSPIIFKWLDTFGGPTPKGQQLKQLHQIYAQDGAEFFFAMLARQIRLLIGVKTAGELKMAPFMLSKLKKQASYFTQEQLLGLHAQLVKIDLAQKTSGSRLSLEQQLDLLIL